MGGIERGLERVKTKESGLDLEEERCQSSGEKQPKRKPSLEEMMVRVKPFLSHCRWKSAVLNPSLKTIIF